MDRFVNGEDVPREQLRRVWEEDTTAGTSVWERPIYEEFFRAVRALNASLGAERRLRALLGDAPIDRDRVKRREDQFDALLYLGSASAATTARLPPELCRDPAYMAMRLGRLALEHPALGKASGEWLKAYCRAQVSK
jgi:hypothetical protein